MKRSLTSLKTAIYDWFIHSISGFHLSFSLINDEPETGILNWNIQEAIASKNTR